MASLQGEEGPPSLEYIQAKDLFPPKELVKEEENLQVRRMWEPGRWAPSQFQTPSSEKDSPGPVEEGGALPVCDGALAPGPEGSFPV